MVFNLFHLIQYIKCSLRYDWWKFRFGEVKRRQQDEKMFPLALTFQPNLNLMLMFMPNRVSAGLTTPRARLRSILKRKLALYSNISAKHPQVAFCMNMQFCALSFDGFLDYTPAHIFLWNANSEGLAPSCVVHCTGHIWAGRPMIRCHADCF